MNKMDTMKANVAAAVRRQIMQLDNSWFVPPDTEGVEAAHVRVVDDLNTQLRVRTPTGTRYFNVKLSEML